ncbi:Uncharacterised protein [Yersinia frederiksenii]|nr:Uncharacterised protein [Yersinia frederiksenii]
MSVLVTVMMFRLTPHDHFLVFSGTLSTDIIP